MSFPVIEAILRKFHCSILKKELAEFSETMVIFFARLHGSISKKMVTFKHDYRICSFDDVKTILIG